MGPLPPEIDYAKRYGMVKCTTLDILDISIYIYIFVYFESRLTASEQMFWRLCSSQPDKLAPRCPVSIVMYLYLRPICRRYLYLQRVCLRYLYLHHVCLAK